MDFVELYAGVHTSQRYRPIQILNGSVYVLSAPVSVSIPVSGNVNEQEKILQEKGIKDWFSDLK